MAPRSPRTLRLGLAGLTAAALLAAGFLVFRERPESAPPEPPAEASAATDPLALADSIYARCADQTFAEKTDCYERRLVPLVSSAGVRAALEALTRLGTRDPDVSRHGHVYAHAIGIQAFRARPDVAVTFARCTEIYQSGCYHGVIQAYFERAGEEKGRSSPTAADVNAVCRSYHEAGASRWLLFQCVHGMGHGLTMLHGHDLPRALRDCDLLEQAWDRESCYGGAFMENIVNATAPHHMLATSADAGGHDGHHPGGGPAQGRKEAFRALDPADPHYPCSILEEKYVVACYQMQTSAILFQNGGDIRAAARTCDGAPPGLRPTCYQSLGRDISAYALQDHLESIRLCSLGSPRYRPWCYVGVVKNFVDLTSTTGDAFAFCRRVPEIPGKLKCHEALGEQIGVLESRPSEREALCLRSEPAFLEACRYGARLRGVPPPGLSRAG